MMKPKGAILLAICALAASVALANKRPEVPTVENMAGAWRSAGPWNLHYRLVLDTDGKGSLVMKRGASDVTTYRIVSTEFKRYAVRMLVRSLGSASEEFVVSGDGDPYGMTLTSKHLLRESSVTFYPEAEWREGEAGLESLP